jgi:hypothetical protein
LAAINAAFPRSARRELSEAQNAFRNGGATNLVKARIDYFKRRQAGGEHGLHLWIAKDLARLGQREEALRSLELAVDERLSEALRANIDPEFRDFRNEPRFEEVLRRLGFRKPVTSSRSSSSVFSLRTRKKSRPGILSHPHLFFDDELRNAFRVTQKSGSPRLSKHKVLDC